jgi:UDP-N-acetylmuramate--alanine ligase
MTGAIRSAAAGARVTEWSGLRVYMVGIGGCGMSGLARMLAARGAVVSGSDVAATEVTAGLERDGIAVSLSQASGRIPEGTSVVVASAAISRTTPSCWRRSTAGWRR